MNLELRVHRWNCWNMQANADILIKAYVFISCRDILITNLVASMSYDELCDEVHEMCNLQQEQPITLKWIDDEGICTEILLRLSWVYCPLWYKEGALRKLVYIGFMLWSYFLFLNTRVHNTVLC